MYCNAYDIRCCATSYSDAHDGGVETYSTPIAEPIIRRVRFSDVLTVFRALQRPVQILVAV